MDIKDSVVVITGAARGIGRTIAQSLAAAGAKLVLGDILAPELTKSVESIEAQGGSVIGVVADVTKDSDVEKLLDAGIEKFGAINVVCANAGIVRDQLMLATDATTGRIASVFSTEAFRAVVEVNLVGTFITLREAARRMADQKWPGVLIVISSIHHTGQPGLISYSSTKTALTSWPKILVGELHSSGITNIRVAGIAPGVTGTEAIRNLSPATLEEITKDVHLRRLVEPEEIAFTVRHIIENDAIDGTTIEVTAGATYGAWQRAR